jgi:hypothetical protein
MLQTAVLLQATAPMVWQWSLTPVTWSLTALLGPVALVELVLTPVSQAAALVLALALVQVLWPGCLPDSWLHWSLQLM